jgi:hypothetical protein
MSAREQPIPQMMPVQAVNEPGETDFEAACYTRPRDLQQLTNREENGGPSGRDRYIDRGNSSGVFTPKKM